jgi:hypothetical protein
VRDAEVFVATDEGAVAGVSGAAALPFGAASADPPVPVPKAAAPVPATDRVTVLLEAARLIPVAARRLAALGGTDEPRVTEDRSVGGSTAPLTNPSARSPAGPVLAHHAVAARAVGAT